MPQATNRKFPCCGHSVRLRQNDRSQHVIQRTCHVCGKVWTVRLVPYKGRLPGAGVKFIRLFWEEQNADHNNPQSES